VLAAEARVTRDSSIRLVRIESLLGSPTAPAIAVANSSYVPKDRHFDNSDLATLSIALIRAYCK